MQGCIYSIYFSCHADMLWRKVFDAGYKTLQLKVVGGGVADCQISTFCLVIGLGYEHSWKSSWSSNYNQVRTLSKCCVEVKVFDLHPLQKSTENFHPGSNHLTSLEFHLQCINCNICTLKKLLSYSTEMIQCHPSFPCLRCWHLLWKPSFFLPVLFHLIASHFKGGCRDYRLGSGTRYCSYTVNS